MPIKFLCNHCGQKLSVGSQRAGTKANCPRCKEIVRIPGEKVQPSRATMAASMLVMSGQPESELQPGPPAEEEAFAPPVAGSDAPYVESSELVFDTSPNTGAEAGNHSAGDVVQRTDYNLVSFPRYVLYAQAGLLAGVAVICFTLGALMGGAFFRGQPEGFVAKPIKVRGFVQVTQGAVKKGDEGAVVVVLPQDVQKVDERAPVSGLRPRDPMPDETHRGRSIITQLGGGYAKAGRDGSYEITVPRQGKYFIVVISRAKTGDLDDIQGIDLQRIARFFDNANELLGTQQYRFSEETLLANRKHDVSFE